MVTSPRDDRRATIWLMSLATQRTVAITRPRRLYFDPVFSADGSHLFYAALDGHAVRVFVTTLRGQTVVDEVSMGESGPYEIVAPIGAGGMGEVFRARRNTAQGGRRRQDMIGTGVRP